MGALNQEVRHLLRVTVVAGGAPKTGLVNADFTKTLQRKSGNTLVADTATVVVSEIDPALFAGEYWAVYTPVTATGKHVLEIKTVSASWSVTETLFEDEITGGAAVTTGPFLSTRANVKLALALSTDGDDQRIDALLASETAEVQSYCGTLFFSASYTHDMDGSGTDQMILRERPVASVTSLYVSLDAPRVYDATTLVASSLYVLDQQAPIIKRIDGGFFPEGPRTVRAIYAAGYATIPSDLERAVIECISVKLAKGKSSGYHVLSENRGDGNVSFVPDGVMRHDWPLSALAVFNRYRVMVSV